MAEYIVEFGKRSELPEADGRLDAPAFHRNHAPIWSALAPYLAEASGNALEIGSGSGQHVVDFAAKTPRLIWWPSDPDPRHRASIAGWRNHAGLPNVRAPRPIDIAAADWRSECVDALPQTFRAIVCINVLHISPWMASEGLMRAAATVLEPDGRLFIYGPFMRDGRHTAPSNAAFDTSLRRENAEWGLRDVSAIGAEAEHYGLRLRAAVDMPANNMVLIVEPRR